MKTLYFHIGLGKTGTTSIQKCLENQFFIYYPKIMKQIMKMWVSGIGNPITLMNDLKVWDNLHKEIENIDKDIIISNEGFIYYLNTETLYYIKKLFYNFDIKIIFCVRNLNDLIISSYKEHQYRYLTNKNYYNLDLFVDWIKKMKNGFDFNLLIEKWEIIFKQEKINVLVYDKNIIHNFFNLLNINSKNIIINEKKFNCKTLNINNINKFINDFNNNNSADIESYNIYDINSNNKNEVYHMSIKEQLSEYNYQSSVENFCLKYKIDKNILI